MPQKGTKKHITQNGETFYVVNKNDGFVLFVPLCGNI